MEVLTASTVWVDAPGQEGRKAILDADGSVLLPAEPPVPPADRVRYLIRRPTYYSSVAFRERFARAHGLVYSELELLAEIANGLEVIEPVEEKRALARKTIGLAVIESQGGGPLKADDRQRLSLLRQAARRVWRPFRDMEADARTAEERLTLERVRAFVVDWSGLYDVAGWEAARLALVEETGDAAAAPEWEAFKLDPDLEDAGDGSPVLSPRSLECIPFADIQFLARKVAELDRPLGAAKKNSPSPSFGITTPEPSNTGPSSRPTTPRPKAKRGSSPTSTTRKSRASRSA